MRGLQKVSATFLRRPLKYKIDRRASRSGTLAADGSAVDDADEESAQHLQLYSLTGREVEEVRAPSFEQATRSVQLNRTVRLCQVVKLSDRFLSRRVERLGYFNMWSVRVTNESHCVNENVERN